jgi:hypothetical protein
MTLIWKNTVIYIWQLVQQLPEDGCGWQPKHVRALKPTRIIVQLGWNQLVYKKTARKTCNVKFIFASSLTHFLTMILLLGGTTTYYHPPPPGNDPTPNLQDAEWAAAPIWTCAENIAPSGFDLRIVQAVVSCYTDLAIPAIPARELYTRVFPTSDKIHIFFCINANESQRN